MGAVATLYPKVNDMSEILGIERDCIVALGLLARNFIRFDPPIPVAGKTTHSEGFNVHCCVIDNVDGEVLALEQNAIHSKEDPLQHAEQRAIRAALARLHEKRPRSASQTVEEYYKSSLFMSPGETESDFIRSGCTLYNTFDPCAMCAVTLLIAYMKRIVYVIDDVKYATVYEDMKSKYFSSRQSQKSRVELPSSRSALVDGARELVGELVRRIANQSGVELIHALDHCREELGRAGDLLRRATSQDLVTTGDDLQRNLRTLSDLQRACNFPVQ